MAAGHTIRCTNCNRLGHTTGKYVSKVRPPPAVARAERSVMSVISCFNCGRSGHIAKECRQRSFNELRGPSVHAEFGRHETTMVNLSRQCYEGWSMRTKGVVLILGDRERH